MNGAAHTIARPHPIPHGRIEDADEAPSIRRLHCRSYDTCLDIADRAGWSGFACRGCDAFEERTAEERIWDAHRLITLTAEVLSRKRQKARAWPDDPNQGLVSAAELQAAEEQRNQRINNARSK